ncbi:hypothetical protein ANCCEY_06507 [Ancylostoma ceylanicum]|uniref:Uncharacterized protein n=1 Tax=Ancylostoma ceylanicum TaxID=53326 RepID=A0A0D6LWB8_9BILA|nr:hypothetical protein ANCCEY_06507 [Ancylostoma ceylanicum]
MNLTRPISVVAGEKPPTVYDVVNTGQPTSGTGQLLRDARPPQSARSVLERGFVAAPRGFDPVQAILAVVAHHLNMQATALVNQLEYRSALTASPLRRPAVRSDRSP